MKSPASIYFFFDLIISFAFNSKCQEQVHGDHILDKLDEEQQKIELIKNSTIKNIRRKNLEVMIEK